MRTQVLLFAALAALLFNSLPAKAAQLVEESTGERYEQRPQLGNIDYTCLGAGVRKMLFVKVYSVAFCMESTDVANSLAPFASHDTSQLHENQAFYDALVHAPGGKMAELHMLRDVSVTRLGAAFRDSLKDVLPAHKVEKLVATIPGDAQRGDVVRLVSSADGDLSITVGGRTRVLRDGEIASNVWRVWLGADSVAPSLKEAIAKQAWLAGRNS